MLTIQNLLRKETSIFKSLCQKSGKFNELYRAAERKEKGEGGEISTATSDANLVDVSDSSETGDKKAD